jgi:hypothetical protein
MHAAFGQCDSGQASEQTIEHQLAHARAAGFVIDEVVADNGLRTRRSRGSLLDADRGSRLNAD